VARAYYGISEPDRVNVALLRAGERVHGGFIDVYVDKPVPVAVQKWIREVELVANGGGGL
jgi:hypothetical protein